MRQEEFATIASIAAVLLALIGVVTFLDVRRHDVPPTIQFAEHSEFDGITWDEKTGAPRLIKNGIDMGDNNQEWLEFPVPGGKGKTFFLAVRASR
jgi:hypothetical protein